MTYSPYCNYQNIQNNTKDCQCYLNFNKWSQIPYPSEEKVYHGIDNTAGSWPLYYIKRNSINSFSTLNDEPISLQLLNPSNIDYKAELLEVENVQANLTQCQIGMANYWGTGVPVNQWTPIALQLITTYKVTPPKSARILSTFQNAINDAFVMCWYFKFLWDYPRPVQLNRDFKTVLNTPKFPTYPSGHSAVSAAASTVLAYYFPKEAEKLHQLAEDASISRLYAGIHFRSDLEQGLRLGKQIGEITIDYIKTQTDLDGISVDVHYTTFEDAPIVPHYC